jgi:hypothetical protein
MNTLAVKNIFVNRQNDENKEAYTKEETVFLYKMQKNNFHIKISLQ